MKDKLHKQRLYWLTNHYTYYHDYLFQRISKDESFDLVVCYRQLILESHPWKVLSKSNYRIREMARIPFGLDFRLLSLALISRHNFIIAGWDNLMYIIIITILRLKGRSFGVFSDTPSKPKNDFKQRVKKLWLKWVFSSKANGKLLVTGNIGVMRSREYFQLNADQVLNFPFATDHNIFYPKKEANISKKVGPVIYLIVGRIDFNHKGQDIALKAFANLLNKGVRHFRIRIAGVGEDLLKMQDLITKHNLKEHVEYLGWVEISDLTRLFNESHFTLHTSHEDPFPNSILESLSCGIPVISSDGAGSAVDRIKHGVNGFLFPDGNIETLVELLEATLEMPEPKWQEMKIKCREMALEWPVEYNLNLILKLFSKTSI